ncbi:PepSY domain-containing protein [Pseudenhygromyxa sp. WMMC2535]|uniref:PepSY domain-containing protein n=1 Tax=Pseudenhygromyxa sp. WMMC2535 TaxID=2712867 RepID=UPI001553C827
MSLPADADSELSFQVDRGNGRQPQRRTSITMARGEASAAALQGTGWSSLERSQQVRSFIRFGHTGEMFGGLGMLLAALASLAGAVLAYTGVALTWRRWRAWQARRERDA